MVSTEGVGIMAVVALSSGVLFAVLKAHHNLVSEVQRTIELELGRNHKHHHRRLKKRVTFAKDVVEPSANGKEYRNGRSGRRYKNPSGGGGGEDLPLPTTPVSMPLNRVALYAGKWENMRMRDNSD